MISEALATDALRYAAAGISVMPVGPDKRPLAGWAQNQERVTPSEELSRQLKAPGASGIAAVMGRVSGGFVCLDFDADKEGHAHVKVDTATNLSEFLEAIAPYVDTSTLVIVQTQSGGYHVYFRCDKPEGNTKLAAVPGNNRQGKVVVLETRGEGGYAVLPGSRHPNGGEYRLLQGDLTTAPLLSEEQYQAVMRAARALDKMPPKVDEQSLTRAYKQQDQQGGIIEAFNKKYHPTEILERNSYKKVQDKWCSPDSSSGNAGVVAFRDAPLIFSHHADALGDGKAHDAFDVYAILEHGGDKRAAAREAAAELGLTSTKAQTAPDTEEDAPPQKEQRKSQATELVELVKASNAELFHDSDDKAYITVPVASHYETFRLKSTAARAWFRRLYREATNKSIGGQAMQDTLNDLEGIALFDGPSLKVHIRVAPYRDGIVIDLGDESHQVIRVTPEGWHLEAYSPVKFIRSKSTATLPVPTRGGTLDPLWLLLNVNPEDHVLLAAWLAKALTAEGPYPLLPLHGEQGSAKSTTARAIRALIDPSTAPLRSAPRSPHDLMIAASSARVPTFDNLSVINQELSDALCILSTGGGYATRTLYSDDEETILEAVRPVIMTAISDIATKPDLLDRCIILYLPRITDAKRKSEREFWAAFNQVHAGVLGALLTAVSAGLLRVAHVKLAELPRMADFAVWAVACEEALGFKPGSFMARYNEVRQDANELALDTNPLPIILRDFTKDERGDWYGTPTELLDALTRYLTAKHEERTLKNRDWPKRADKLSALLRRYAPNLRATGLEVEFERTTKHRLIHLRTVTQSSVISVTGVTHGEKARQGQHLVNDARYDAKHSDDASSVITGVIPKSPSGTEKLATHDANDANDARILEGSKDGWEEL